MRKDILKSIFIIVILNILGKIFGMGRNVVIGYKYGATDVTDSVFLAQGVMNDVVYAISTAIGVAFIPVYLGQKQKYGSESAAVFTSKVVSFLSVFALLISIVVMIFSKYIAKIIAPSMTEQHGQIQIFLIIFSSAIIFTVLTSLQCELLNAEKIFGYVAIAGVIYSLTLILSILFLEQYAGIYALVFAIPLAYLIQFTVLSLRTRKVFRFIPDFHWNDDSLKNLIKSSSFVLFSNIIVELNQFVARFIASDMGMGAVSALNYYGVLQQFVTATIILSVVTVFFTEFSENSDNNIDHMKKLFCQGNIFLLALTIPITIIVFFLSHDIVSLVYGYGKFDNHAVTLTAIGLKYISFLFISFGLYNMSMRLFFALKHSKTAMYISIATMCISIICSIVFARLFGFAGIAIGGGIAFFAGAILACIMLQKQIGNLGVCKYFPDFMKLLGSAAGAVILAYFIKDISVHFILRLIIVTLAIFITYLLLLFILRFSELKHINKIFYRKRISK